MGAAEVAAAIDADLAKLEDPRVRAGIHACRLATPTPIKLGWDYGEPGETYDGWLVFDDPHQGTGIAYCERGFGPRSPWGLIATGEPIPRMGMDSGWFGRFTEAYFDSFSATTLPIWRVVRWTESYGAREPVTGELPWDEAWQIVDRLRQEDPAHKYACDHGISY
jgi:hypothetical protein